MGMLVLSVCVTTVWGCLCKWQTMLQKQDWCEGNRKQLWYLSRLISRMWMSVVGSIVYLCLKCIVVPRPCRPINGENLFAIMQDIRITTAGYIMYMLYFEPTMMLWTYVLTNKCIVSEIFPFFSSFFFLFLILIQSFWGIQNVMFYQIRVFFKNHSEFCFICYDILLFWVSVLVNGR